MKTIGYLIFACFFYVFKAFCKIKKKKVFCIMTHDSSKDSNVGVMVEYLKKRKEDYTFIYLSKSEKSSLRNRKKVCGLFSFFIVKPYHLATSEIVLMDNVFLPMAYLRFRKRVRIIQLWHGTGTIKKFGQDVNVGRLKKLEKKANSRITQLIVNSERTKKLYAKAFGVEEEKVFAYGLPRTDLFFNERWSKKRVAAFYEKYPSLKNKKLILYVPTFRDSEAMNPRLELDLDLWCKEMPEDYVLLLKMHPFIADRFEINNKYKESYSEHNNIVDMSTYPDISTLLLLADCLITDYSSVIFEYCLLRRPMIFFAYDLEEFSNQGRGFYELYEEYVPGPIVKDTNSIIAYLKKGNFDLDRVEAFTLDSYGYFDGKSAERIYLNIISGGKKVG